MPPDGYVADPTNPGWWYDPTKDISSPDAWWQEPPAGYVADPTNPGWWYDPTKDVTLLDTWWHDATIIDAPEANWYDPVFARARELYGGSPYAFGGDRIPGKSIGPWDCIGYVMECLDAASPRLGDFQSGMQQGYINAERARQFCAFVPEGDEQAGDLIFFEKTYSTAGASHVGFVIDPVRHIMADDHDRGNNTGPGETDYTKAKWPQHFMQFGRVPR